MSVQPCSAANDTAWSAPSGLYCTFSTDHDYERCSRPLVGCSQSIALCVTVGMCDFSLADQAGRGASPFPPRTKQSSKAIACESVFQTMLPLSRLSTWTWPNQLDGFGPIDESQHRWRISTDAIKPWRLSVLIFPGPKVLRKKPGASWTCIRSGRAKRWAAETTSSAPMIRRAFRPAFDVMRLCRRGRDVPCEWNMSTTRRPLAVSGRLGLAASGPGSMREKRIDSFGRLVEQ